MALMPNLIGQSAAADLGLTAGANDPDALDMLKKKKLLEAQQTRDMASKMGAPYTGAFMSLTGNQF